MVQYTVFPGRGGTPLQPQQFYIQTYVGIFPPFNQTDWPLAAPSRPLDQSWNFNLVGAPWRVFVPPDTTKIFRGHLRSLPAQPPPPNAFQSWTWQYNLNLIGKDRLPVGNYPGSNQIDDLAPAHWAYRPMVEQYHWAWKYNLNLIGKDRLPTGKVITELPPRDYQRWQDIRTWLQTTTALTLPPPSDTIHILRPIWRSLPDQPVQPLQQQSTFPNFNVLQPTVVTFIIRQSDWPLPFAPRQPAQTWTWQYNINLIGKDAMLVGEQVYDLAPPQRQPDQVQLRSWQWSYSLNLIGKDRMTVGDQVTDLAPSQRPPEQVQLHSWSWTYNLNLIGKDAMIAGEQVYDLAPSQRPPEQTQLHTWQWSYNLNLIGQDRFPTGEQVYDRPILSIPPAQTWLDLPKYNLIAKPFLQVDWPNPTQPYRLEQTWVRGYNLSLIGQDLLPFRQQDWPLPQVARPPAQTWTDPFKIWLTAPVLNITISQYFDRPQLPVPPAQSWTASYLLSLIGQDRMVTGEQITDLPPRDFARLFQTWISSVNLALTTAPPNLYAQARQQDWPTPRGAEPDWRRSWEFSYNKNLIGQDQLPVRQMDWPNPSRAQEQARDWIAQTKILLAAVQNPFRQTDWPLPRPHAQPAQSWATSFNLNLVGQDLLPFRQSDWPLTPAAQRSVDLGTWLDRTKFLLQRPTAQLDWPLPRAPQQPALGFTAQYNPNLIGQDQLPNRQQDWPLSSAHALSQIPLQIMVAGKPFFLIPPQPLPPGVQFHGTLYDRPQLRPNASADLSNPAWRWPQITPPAVSGVIPLRTLMGTGV